MHIVDQLVKRAAQEHLLEELKNAIAKDKRLKTDNNYRSELRHHYCNKYRKPLIFTRQQYKDRTKENKLKHARIISLQTKIDFFHVVQVDGQRRAFCSLKQGEEERANKSLMQPVCGFKKESFIKGKFDNIYESLLQYEDNPFQKQQINVNQTQQSNQEKSQAKLAPKMDTRRRAITCMDEKMEISKKFKYDDIGLPSPSLKSYKNSPWISKDVALSQVSQCSSFEKRIFQLGRIQPGRRILAPLVSREHLLKHMNQLVPTRWAHKIMQFFGIKSMETVDRLNSIFKDIYSLNKQKSCLLAFFLYDSDQDGVIGQKDIFNLIEEMAKSQSIKKDVQVMLRHKITSFRDTPSFRLDDRISISSSLKNYLRLDESKITTKRNQRARQNLQSVRSSRMSKLFISQFEERFSKNKNTPLHPKLSLKNQISLNFINFNNFFRLAPEIVKDIIQHLFEREVGTSIAPTQCQQTKELKRTDYEQSGKKRLQTASQLLQNLRQERNMLFDSEVQAMIKFAKL